MISSALLRSCAILRISTERSSGIFSISAAAWEFDGAWVIRFFDSVIWKCSLPTPSRRPFLSEVSSDAPPEGWPPPASRPASKNRAIRPHRRSPEELTAAATFERLKVAVSVLRPYVRSVEHRAVVAELADAHGSGPCTRKGVGVRVPPSAPLIFFPFSIVQVTVLPSSYKRKDADAA